jgi:hypothetical protein
MGVPGFIVETATTDGMHEIVSIAQSDDQVPASAALAEARLAQLRSAVRGYLDLIGHESGTARMEVGRTEGGLRVLSCQTSDTPLRNGTWSSLLAIPRRAGTLWSSFGNGSREREQRRRIRTSHHRE